MKILYIAGETRSGSTILGNILDQIDGFFFAGELLNIWRYALIEHRQCTCGKDPAECEIWKPILQKAFGYYDEQFPASMEQHRRQTNYNRYLPYYLIPSLRRRFFNVHREYLESLESLYQAIHTVTGCDVIVDSSKRPTYGKLLSSIPTLDVYVLHLVRDPRAVSYSWLRKKYQTDGREYREYMYQSNVYRSAILWNVRNLSAEMFWGRDPRRYLLMRYEDFINNPRSSILRVLNALGCNADTLPFVSDSTVTLSINHSIWGNPVRHHTGQVELKLDDEWRQRFDKKKKLIVDLLTIPWLYRYNYLSFKN